MIIAELITQGVAEDHILYFHLDKRPYANVKKPEELDKLIEENSHVEGMKYLFIDEIQNVRNFETVINSWREEGDFSIFLTGSNSYLLSGELATKLTGRYLEFNILPLTLDEYVGIKRFSESLFRPTHRRFFRNIFWKADSRMPLNWIRRQTGELM